MLTASLNVLCNNRVSDAELIDELGGPAAVAAKLGYPKWGTQRVSNWKVRGIPARVKVERPDLFMPAFNEARASREAQAAPEAPEPNAWPLQGEAAPERAHAV